MAEESSYSLKTQPWWFWKQEILTQKLLWSQIDARDFAKHRLPSPDSVLTNSLKLPSLSKETAVLPQKLLKPSQAICFQENHMAAE